MSKLFSRTRLGSLELQNHLVMAPMTRSRAIGNVPNELMAVYYGQRNSAGLILTEGTTPSKDGLGYPRIPGIYSQEQVRGWQGVCEAAHQGGAKIFLQLMHCGRIGHPLNIPEGGRLLAPSAIAAAGEMYTDAEGLKPHPVPGEMTVADIQRTIGEFVQAAKHAVEAGFDGIELHGANGYLLEQFFRPGSNQRTDDYGGSREKRGRFVLECVRASIEAIGAQKVGIRLSPYGVFNDMPVYEEMEADYAWLAAELQKTGLAYIHLVDHGPMGAPPVPDSITATFRKTFSGTLILSGGYDAERAEADLAAGRADLIAVGRPFLAKPDLPARWQKGTALNQVDMNTFYTPGEAGYTDYPALA